MVMTSNVININALLLIIAMMIYDRILLFGV